MDHKENVGKVDHIMGVAWRSCFLCDCHAYALDIYIYLFNREHNSKSEKRVKKCNINQKGGGKQKGF